MRSTDPKSPLAAVNRGRAARDRDEVYEDAASAIALEAEVRRRAGRATSFGIKPEISDCAHAAPRGGGIFLWLDAGNVRGSIRKRNGRSTFSRGGQMTHEAQKEAFYDSAGSVSEGKAGAGTGATGDRDGGHEEGVTLLIDGENDAGRPRAGIFRATAQPGDRVYFQRVGGAMLVMGSVI